ncbi:MAG: FtsX-like permease family protein [Cytophagales bacterium]|nr:ABC transporter permease [Bernardetiaceae bacterium]MDW8211428.1 FtsX-like permease family protein [Cytophagales bacterium]
MNVAFFVALRYLFSKKKSNFINFISAISVAGVAVSTAAMVIVLSVFNGLEEFTRSLYASYHADLEITPVKGKSFPVDRGLVASLSQIQGVQAVTEVIADDALLRYKDLQLVVKVKGVSENFNQQYPISTKLVGGTFALKQEGAPRALIGIGVQMQLGIDLANDLEPLVFWYPRKDRQVDLANPANNFQQRLILAGGTLAIEQQFDQSHVLVPLEWAEDLMQYKQKRTSLEIKVQREEDVISVQKAVQQLIAPRGLQVKNRQQQQESIMRAIKIEKLFVFVALAFVLAVASFNIFFTLSMLAIEKQRDIAIFIAMGALPRLVSNIFLVEGFFIACVGAFTGLALGLLICLLQSYFGLVSLGIQSSLIQSYPVVILWTDFVAIGLVTFVITFLASYAPAWRATAVNVPEQL